MEMICIILVINLGSSTLKFNLFSNSENLCSICSGICECIGFEHGIVRYTYKGKLNEINVHLKNHKEAFAFIKKILFDEKNGPIKHYKDLEAIGHRVVHGGEYFPGPVLVDDSVIEKIKDLIPLAPIHNAVNLEGILDCRIEFPNIPQVAVFDTSFFYNLPEKVKNYPIPNDLSKKYRIRKYGFHGISHSWAYERYTKIAKRKDCKVISCHLGSGSSVCAIKSGLPLDISMGLTPLGGLMMGTRSGSIDPSVVTYLMDKSGMSCQEMNELLNKHSGLLGISEFSGDIRKIMDKNDQKCILALDMFIYRIIKYIGSYIASLNGVDSIVFTGGIGENVPYIRRKVCKNFEFLGVDIDENLNNKTISGVEGLISSEKSKIKICVVKSNEEFSIAELTVKTKKR